jgi:hypothetical protein
LKRTTSSRLGMGVGADQQRQSFDGGEAAGVEDDRLGGEGGELLVPVGDASRFPLLVPALRAVGQPPAPEAEAGLPGERGRLDALELDAAGKGRAAVSA